MIPLDDLPSLALFARVVDQRSFSAAAREAGMAKSAVSRRIAALERRLGISLLRRSTRALSVTDDGLRVYEHCAALLAAARAAEEAARARAGVSGSIRVNGPVTLSQMHLARAVAGFLHRHPEVEVNLFAEDRLVDVIEGGFDVVVRIGRLADSALRSRKLAADRLVVCASPEYLARHGAPTAPADLVHHECLHYSLVPRAAEWRFRATGGGVLSVPTRGRFSSSNGTVLREAALAGVGVVVLPLFMVAREVDARQLVLLLEGARRARIGIYAVTAGGPAVAPRTRALIDHLAHYFARPRWMQEPAAGAGA
ncbi:MAG: LysR family transcriptional regulator [Polyangia bacterium]|jgi:DNA-binding transcriptional LysR family regulator